MQYHTAMSLATPEESHIIKAMERLGAPANLNAHLVRFICPRITGSQNEK